MDKLLTFIVLGLFMLVHYGHCAEQCNGYRCEGDKECCSNGCCEKFWSTWRIIVVAGAGVVGLGLIIVLIIVGVYQVCYKGKNKMNNNNVTPMQQMPGGSGYDQPPPAYEYNINSNNDTAFMHPPPLPAYSKGLGPGEKKIAVKAFNEE